MRAAMLRNVKLPDTANRDRTYSRFPKSRKVKFYTLSHI
jgi:hypothetical protein